MLTRDTNSHTSRQARLTATVDRLKLDIKNLFLDIFCALIAIFLPSAVINQNKR